MPKRIYEVNDGDKTFEVTVDDDSLTEDQIRTKIGEELKKTKGSLSSPSTAPASPSSPTPSPSYWEDIKQGWRSGKANLVDMLGGANKLLQVFEPLTGPLTGVKSDEAERNKQAVETNLRSLSNNLRTSPTPAKSEVLRGVIEAVPSLPAAAAAAYTMPFLGPMGVGAAMGGLGAVGRGGDTIDVLGNAALGAAGGRVAQRAANKGFIRATGVPALFSGAVTGVITGDPQAAMRDATVNAVTGGVLNIFHKGKTPGYDEGAALKTALTKGYDYKTLLEGIEKQKFPAGLPGDKSPTKILNNYSGVPAKVEMLVHDMKQTLRNLTPSQLADANTLMTNETLLNRARESSQQSALAASEALRALQTARYDDAAALGLIDGNTTIPVKLKPLAREMIKTRKFDTDDYVFPGGKTAQQVADETRDIAGRYSPEELQRIEGVNTAWRNKAKEYVDRMRNEGMLSEEQVAGLRSIEDWYSPLFREEYTPTVDGPRDPFQKGKKFDVPKVKAIKDITGGGSEKSVEDPRVAFMRKFASQEKQIAENKVARSLLEWADPDVSGLTPDAAAARKVQAQENARGIVEKLGKNAAGEWEDPPDGMFVRRALVNGKEERFAVNQVIEDTLNFSSKPMQALVVNVFKHAGDKLRWGVTRSPGYYIKNFMMDPQTAITNVPGYNPLNMVHGLAAAIQTEAVDAGLTKVFPKLDYPKLYRTFVESGAGMSGMALYRPGQTVPFESVNPKTAGQRLNETVSRLKTQPGAVVVETVGDLLNLATYPLYAPSKIGELTTRLSVVKGLQGRTDPRTGKPYTLDDIGYYAAHGTGDYRLRGTSESANVVAHMLTFLRANAIQKISYAKNATESIGGVIDRAKGRNVDPGASTVQDMSKRVGALAVTLPTILYFYNHSDPEREKIYNELSDETKNNYYVWVRGTEKDPEGKRATNLVLMPKGNTVATAGLTEAFWNYVKKTDPKAFDATAMQFLSNAGPIDFTRGDKFAPDLVASQLMPPSVKGLIDVIVGTDLRTGFKLFPAQMEDASRQEMYNDKGAYGDTPQMYRYLSDKEAGLIGDTTGNKVLNRIISPIGNQHIAQNIGGPIADMVANIAEGNWRKAVDLSRFTSAPLKPREDPVNKMGMGKAKEAAADQSVRSQQLVAKTLNEFTKAASASKVNPSIPRPDFSAYLEDALKRLPPGEKPDTFIDQLFTEAQRRSTGQLDVDMTRLSHLPVVAQASYLLYLKNSGIGREEFSKRVADGMKNGAFTNDEVFEVLGKLVQRDNERKQQQRGGK